jgi:hypothetical protein
LIRRLSRKVMVAGGGGATTALIDLYSSPKPVYRPGPPLSGPRRYLSHATLFDGRVLLAGGQDAQGRPVTTTWWRWIRARAVGGQDRQGLLIALPRRR